VDELVSKLIEMREESAKFKKEFEVKDDKEG
jgi:hypothetical protein